MKKIWILLAVCVLPLAIGCEKKESKAIHFGPSPGDGSTDAQGAKELHFGTSPGDGAAEEGLHFGTSPGDGAAEEGFHFGTSPGDG